MGLWSRRSLSRKPGRASAWRVGITALALLTVTAALALVLAHSSHLAWPPVLVSIVGTLPALYLAWLAVPGATSRAGSHSGQMPSHRRQVRQWDPRRLGVHAAIRVPGMPDEVLPEYVPRDIDTAEHGVQDKVAAAAERGGFVLLVGGSSVGKTRTAVEAVTALLPGWWLVHPAGPAEVAALAQVPSSRTVVWLDELQRYLDGEHGLTGGVVRALLNAPHPAVIIGTLWPDQYAAYAALPAPGGADPHAREREVLDLADVIRVGSEFSPAEQDRARSAAARDPRLQVALESAGYGLTQTLAAAPQLVARWEDARTASPYAWAVLTAAMDVARLGARAALSVGLLREAAPGYWTSQQQAEAPDNWFEQAMAYATQKLHGAAAALSPEGAGTGQVAGYSAADYLIQHVGRERRRVRVPASTWDAVVDRDCSVLLAEWLEERGDLAGAAQVLRTWADAGDRDAIWRLARLLKRLGDLDGLRAWADAGERTAGMRLAELLKERGDLDGLRAWADAGDPYAAGGLAGLLEERGDLDGAAQVLRTWADAGDRHAAVQLARLLEKHGDLDGAAQVTGTPTSGWPSCLRNSATWTSCAAGPTPATGTPRSSWHGCSRSTATWTEPRRSCAPEPTPATGPPEYGWPSCSRSAATWPGPCRSCAPGPTQVTGTPFGGWPSCLRNSATWTSCAPEPTPATGTPTGSWPSCLRSAATSTSCGPGPMSAMRRTPRGWPGY